MNYTILTARLANSEGTAAVLQTEEAGAVLVSVADTPELWEQMLATTALQAYAPLTVVPREVTKRQAAQALILNGLDDDVDALLAGMPGIEGKLARAEWRESNVVRRDRPLVQELGVALGLNDAQLDALFIQAAGL